MVTEGWARELSPSCTRTTYVVEVTTQVTRRANGMYPRAAAEHHGSEDPLTR